jgi:PadR family transcriptional regulator, regulatory protein PadR
MSREALGNFELMVMSAVLKVGDEAYGIPIASEVESATGRNVLLGSVYGALERLEAKGLVTSWLGDPTPERGGRAKKYFALTPKGLREVHRSRKALMTLWRGLPAVQGVAR